MSRIEACFKALEEQQKKALIPYVTAGDPNPESTIALMHAMVEAGADIIELGIPFSDPMADGPVIQKAFERALEKGVTFHHVLDMVKAFREQNQATPVVLMGYLNPAEVIGYEPFVSLSKEAGVDGFIFVDLPPEEAQEMTEICTQADLNIIFLIAPTTTEERIAKIASHGSGYLYYVSLKGVTGSKSLNVDEVAQKLETIGKITDLPVTVGFGIKDAESAAAVAKVSSGAVVGSALVNKITESIDNPQQFIEEISALLKSMRNAMDS